MSVPFPTEQWIKAAMLEVNKSADYQKAAEKWEGDISFVVTAIPGQSKEVHLYMDLWHGECRDAYKITDTAASNPEFTITAPLPVWRKVLEGQLDPIRGLMSRQLKLKGNLMKVVKMPKAAVELVNSCARIDTEWPG
jgi:putative sterol carrier protein